MSAQKLAVITGAARGIGEATAHRLADRGFHVVAGVRRQTDADRLTAAGVETVLLDITRADDIARLVDRIENDPERRRLGVVVNNAAASLTAPAELVPLEAWRSNFDTNFFGHVALTTALTPALVRAGSSRLVNISSMAGVLAGPSFGPYAAAKRALETYSDILRRELARTGVRVIVVQPASVKTEGWLDAAAITDVYTGDMTPEQHERYDALVAAVKTTSARWNRNGIAAADAARIIVDAIEQSAPKTRYRIGKGAGITAGLTRILSDRTMDKLLDRMLSLT